MASYRLWIVGGLAWVLFQSVATAQVVCTTAARANLRAGPGENFPVVWQVNRYMPLVQQEEKGNWLKVKDVDGDTHWIFKSLVDSGQKCVTVHKAEANIRATRGGSRTLYTVKKYTAFKLLDKKGKWVQIAYDEKKMWVFHTLIWPLSL